MADLISEGKQPILTGLQIAGDQDSGETKRMSKRSPPTSLQFSGLAVFKKDRLIGWLNETESKGYNFILGKVKSSVGFVACPKGGKVVMEIIRTHASMKGYIYRGEPQINIHLKIEANVGEVECSELDLTKVSTIYDLQKRSEEKIAGVIESAIKKAQNRTKLTFSDSVKPFTAVTRRLGSHLNKIGIMSTLQNCR